MSAPEKAKIFFLRCRFLALPLLLALSDFSIRRSYLFSQSAKEFGIFFLSVFYEILFYAVIFFLLSRVKKLRTLLIGIFSAGLSVVLILLYGHYFYFGVLPNNASINFILDHVQDAFALTSASIHWYHGIIFMLLFIIIFFFTKLGTEAAASFSKKISYSSLALFLGISLVLNNNVRFHPDSYSITPNMLFAVNYVAQERLFGSQFEIRRGYVKRQFTILPKEKTVPAFNCLLLIGESVRGKNMHYNGYQRETTPFVDSLLSSGRSISFPRYAANCVSTQYAVPLILSGNFTAEKLPQPYIYDYLKSWTTAKTFFVSSQSMVVSQCKRVI
ncbi:MAG: hypothetical protein H3C35_13000 [Bacteroidetes bacterium]|nr:hypothetical protein [Bacteroidota bacterium]